MNLSEEELKEWEARVSKLGSGLAYGESLRLIQEVRDLKAVGGIWEGSSKSWKLIAKAAEHREKDLKQRLDNKTRHADKLERQMLEIEHREKVAMRALELEQQLKERDAEIERLNSCKTTYDTNLSTLANNHDIQIRELTNEVRQTREDGYIKGLEDGRKSGLEEASNWISVKDRLPEDMEYCIVFRAGYKEKSRNGMDFDFMQNQAFWYSYAKHGFGATHWMLKPDSPKGPSNA